MSQKSGPGWVRGTGRRDCPVGYPVKGNEPSNVFYEPGDPGYPQVIPEMCFEDAATAERVGFTAVKGGGAAAAAAAPPAGFLRTSGGRECPSGYPIKGNRVEAGVVTSGSPSPTLGKNIGLGYVPVGHDAIGNTIVVDCRGKDVEAVIVKTPFYKRK